MSALLRSAFAVATSFCLNACSTDGAPAGRAVNREPRMQSALQQSVDKYARTLVQTYRIPGLSVLVMQGGRTIAEARIGNCSVEFEVPVTDRCVFHLASASKLFTGVALMRLAQDGRLHLDDPISRYLPDLPEAWRPATIRQIMTHTSGIPNFFEAPGYQNLSEEERAALTPEQLIALAAAQPMDGPPGGQWVYAQTGVMLAGLVVERVTGRAYNLHMRDQLFAPLGMEQTTYGDSSLLVAGRSSTAYRWLGGVLRAHIYPYPPPMYPAAGLNSSPRDLSRFFAALSSNEILSDDNKARMWERARLTDGRAVDYGFGWDLTMHDGVAVAQHSGAGSVWLGYVPSENLTILFLTNLNGVEREFEQSLRPDNPIFGILDIYEANG